MEVRFPSVLLHYIKNTAVFKQCRCRITSLWLFTHYSHSCLWFCLSVHSHICIYLLLYGEKQTLTHLSSLNGSALTCGVSTDLLNTAPSAPEITENTPSDRRTPSIEKHKPPPVRSMHYNLWDSTPIYASLQRPSAHLAGPAHTLVGCHEDVFKLKKPSNSSWMK